MGEVSLDDEIHALNGIAQRNAPLTVFSMRMLLARVRNNEGDALRDARSELAERYAAQLRHKRDALEYSRGAARSAPTHRRRGHALDSVTRRLTLLAPCYAVIEAGHAKRMARTEVGHG